MAGDRGARQSVGDAAHLLAVMTGVAASLDVPRSLGETRERLTLAALDAVPGADHASFTVLHVKTGQIETAAATDDLPRELDDVQYALREGPCYGTVTESDFILIDDFRYDDRWPRYGPHAVEKGIRSQLGIRLRDKESMVAGLNLYATEPYAFRGSLDDVQLVATHARVVLGYARENAALVGGFETRTLIGQAVGIVMERYQVDDHRAFEFLTRVSQTTNTKMRVVADRIVHPDIVHPDHDSANSEG
jgi:hypothetical protein